MPPEIARAQSSTANTVLTAPVARRGEGWIARGTEAVVVMVFLGSVRGVVARAEASQPFHCGMPPASI